jgi:hypothetical protein
MSNNRNLTVRWSEPHRVKRRILNSYELETVNGIDMDSTFSSRRLWPYVAREGTPLALAQVAFMEQARKAAGEEGAADAAALTALRAAEIAEVERWRVEEIGKGLEESSGEWGQ